MSQSDDSHLCVTLSEAIFNVLFLLLRFVVKNNNIYYLIV